jgi:pSer/pThr/pTyr-binding forkhead associated (FHA) protein
MAVLIQVNNVAGVNILIDKSPFRIGRGEGNELRIDDELASREHAVIDCKVEANNPELRDWILRDQKSTNGTFVNDRQITVHALVDGDVLRIGKTFLKFFTNDNASLSETRVMKKTIIPGVYYTTDKS